MIIKTTGKFTCLIILFLNALLPINASADNENLSPSYPEDIVVDGFEDDDDDIVEDDFINIKPEESFFSFLDTPQNFISFGVEAMAKNIDEFFSDDKVFYETSGTYLRLRADSIFNDGGNTSYSGNVRLKLRLPNTKKKLKFTIESDANERPDEATVNAENSPIAVVEKSEYFAGLQATIGKENTWQFKPSIGLKLGSTIEPYVKFRLKRKYSLDEWAVNWYETPFWFNSFGWGLDSYVELNKKISDDNLFRASTFARWTNETDEFELSQVFSMFHTLSKRRAVSYFVGVYGKSEPTVYATHYLLGLTYRQNIHKNYLFIELIPQIRYEKINDFNAEHSIIFRVEMLFKK